MTPAGLEGSRNALGSGGFGPPRGSERRGFRDRAANDPSIHPSIHLSIYLSIYLSILAVSPPRCCTPHRALWQPRVVATRWQPALLQPCVAESPSYVALQLCVAKCSFRAMPRVIPAWWVVLWRLRCHNRGLVVTTHVVTTPFLRFALQTRVSSAFGAFCNLPQCVANLRREPAF